MSMELLAGIILIGGFFLLMMVKVPVTFAMLISTFCSMLVVGTYLPSVADARHPVLHRHG